MRVLLDECLPRALAQALAGHEVITVAHAGWCGMKNGQLLREAAAAGYDAFVTLDRGLPYEQNLSKSDLRIVAVRAHSSRIEDLLPLTAGILDALRTTAAGACTVVGK